MKITPVKDYKKPIFAIGVATVMALSVSACKNPVDTVNDQLQLSGVLDNGVTEENEVVEEGNGSAWWN